MKKVYLLASVFALSATSFAQLQSEQILHHISDNVESTRPVPAYNDADRAPGDPIYQDDFSNAGLWDVSADGNGNAFEIVSTYPSIDQYWGQMASTTAGNGFAIFDGVQYLLAGTVTAQDVYCSLIAPISCTGISNVTLEFEQRYRAFNADQVFVEVSNDGTNWTQWEMNAALAGNGPTVQDLQRIDISSVAGNQANVYVRFHWQELGGDPQFGSGYAWAVDDLNVFESWDYDQQLTDNYFRSGVGVSYPAGLEYYKIPDEQITAIEFSGKTQNLGAQIQTGAKLNVDVSGAGTYTGTSATVDLAVGAGDSLATTTDFTPSAMGTYNISWWVDGTNAEEVTDNDTMTTSIEVTDYEYARDNGIITSSIGNVSSNTGAPLTIGNVFNIFADGTVGAVSIRITDDATNDGQIMFAQIMIFDAGVGEYVYADVTPDYTVTGSDLGSYVTLTFENAVQVSAGDDILVLAGHYGGGTELRFGLSNATDEQTVLGYTSGSATPFFLSSPSAVMMTLDMRDFTSIEENTTNFNIGQNAPNPFDNTSIINYTLEEAANVSVEFVDAAGKVVKSINNGVQTSGSYQIDLSGSDFAEGVYFYTFTIGEQKVTKRMVVTK
ncbi:MAG: T9SS type A sorting domain-containing protein [Crocinitomicaceae bacterium]